MYSNILEIFTENTVVVISKQKRRRKPVDNMMITNGTLHGKKSTLKLNTLSINKLSVSSAEACPTFDDIEQSIDKEIIRSHLSIVLETLEDNETHDLEASG